MVIKLTIVIKIIITAIMKITIVLKLMKIVVQSHNPKTNICLNYDNSQQEVQKTFLSPNIVVTSPTQQGCQKQRPSHTFFNTSTFFTLYMQICDIYIYHIVFWRYANSFSYSSLPNKRGVSNCKFWEKKPSNSFNYYKRMRHESVIPRNLVLRKKFCVGVKEIEKKLK